MGRQSFECRGYGMSEREALNYAMDDARDEFGHQEGYSGTINSCDQIKSKCVKQPVQAKRCIVDKKVQKGTRKWVTVFIIEPRSTFGNEFHSRRQELKNSTQAAALKVAKEMALKYNQEFAVAIVKQIESGGSTIATVTPNKSERGEWKFWGEARC